MYFLYRNSTRSFFTLLLYWVLWEILNDIPKLLYSSIAEVLSYTGLRMLTTGFSQFSVFYILAYFIIPRYVRHRKILKAIAVSLLVFLGSALLQLLLSYHFNNATVEMYRKITPGYHPYFTFVLLNVYGCLTPVILAIAYRFVIDWRLYEKRQILLQKEKSEAQLAFLKTQINAHFLFNTLNNIYSLTLKKSDDAPNAILKLSEMMRFMLYEKGDNNKMVDLNKEISYLKNYVELQLFQTNCNNCVDFVVEGETAGKKITPLILVPFVENAFKHGKLNDPQHPIRILLVMNENKLLFRVTNTKHLQNRDRQGGIGLKNVKERLQLEYEGRHELTIDDNHSDFAIQLTLLLN